MENHGTGVALISQDERKWEETGGRLSSIMAQFQDEVDSPKSLLVLRNGVLTLLEAGEELTCIRLQFLLADGDYRAGILNRIREKTPGLWSEGWNAAWHKDAEPLLSVAHEKIARRNSLIVFWTTEWPSIPEDVKAHILSIVGDLA